MFCPICKQEIKDNSKYCGMCGRKIPRCPTCGMVIQRRMSFCIQDGTPLSEDIISVFPMGVKTEQHFESTGNITETGEQLNCENVREQIASQTEDLYSGGKKRGSCLAPALLGVILAFILGVMIMTGYLILSGEISSVMDLFNLIYVHELKEETLEEEIVNNEDSDITEVPPTELVEKLNAENTVEKSEIEEEAERTTSSNHMDISEDDEKLVSEQQIMPEPIIVESSASSELREYGMTYAAGLAIDGDLETGWVEGISGQGEGESLNLKLSETSVVKGFTIWAGYHKSSDAYGKNSRPKSIRVSFSDDSSMSFELEDSMNAQTFYFDNPVETESVIFTICSVYPGTKYEDTVISEVELL